MVPVGESLVYLQPVYLQSTSAKFPAFQQIIVASPTTVVWGDTLRRGARPAPPRPGRRPGPDADADAARSDARRRARAATPGPQPSPPADDVAALVEYANLHFELAQEALRDGDFARYGEEIALVQEALSQLEQLVGATSPGPAASPSAAP